MELVIYQIEDANAEIRVMMVGKAQRSHAKGIERLRNTLGT